ncbi:hypothetical protein DSECCO2_612870 [anaerobic digester metagenome]
MLSFALWACASLWNDPSPVKVETILYPIFSRIGLISQRSPPILYSPNMLMSNGVGFLISSVPIRFSIRALLAIWCPADWLTPLYPSHRAGITFIPCSFSASLETASMSSPISPTGQVAQMVTASGLKIFTTSSMAFFSFFSPPKTISVSFISVHTQ